MDEKENNHKNLRNKSSFSFSSFSFHQYFNSLLILILGILFYLQRKEISQNNLLNQSSFLSLKGFLSFFSFLSNFFFLKIEEIKFVEEEIKSLSDNTTIKEIFSLFQHLKEDLNQLEIETNMKLEATQHLVNERLDLAVVDLDKAVTSAEKKINDQVEEVSVFLLFFLLFL